MKKAEPKIVFLKNGKVSVTLRGRVLFSKLDLDAAQAIIAGWRAEAAKVEA